ncbi:MAG: hypothetical protein ACPHHQ_00875, partial [Pseudomonadales bacterium]
FCCFGAVCVEVDIGADPGANGQKYSESADNNDFVHKVLPLGDLKEVAKLWTRRSQLNAFEG